MIRVNKYSANSNDEIKTHKSEINLFVIILFLLLKKNTKKQKKNQQQQQQQQKCEIRNSFTGAQRGDSS